MVVVVAILGISMYVVRVAISLLHGFFQNSATVEVQREAQLLLYNISKDIRNCSDIVDASTGTLRLKIFNSQMGYRNPAMFDAVNIGSVTYSYESDSGGSYLRKTVWFPSSGIVEDKKLLKNILLQPDATNYIFNACTEEQIGRVQCTPNSASRPFQAVDIRFVFSPLYVQRSSITLTAQAMRRTRWE